MLLLNNNIIAIVLNCIMFISNGLSDSDTCDLKIYGELTKIKTFTLGEIKSAELVYYNPHGEAQPVQFLLSINKIIFKDTCLTQPDWLLLKPYMPFYNDLMLVLDDDMGLTQSDAINRFLAENTKYKTDTPWEEYLVANYVDTFNDLRRDIKKFLREMEPRKSEIKTYFADKVLPIYMNKFENIVKNNGGYFVKEKFTMADIYFVGIVNSISQLSEVDALNNRESLTKLKNRVFEIQEIKDWLSKNSIQ